MVAMPSGETAPGTESPMKTSAPRRSSSADPWAVVRVRRLRVHALREVQARAAAVERPALVGADDPRCAGMLQETGHCQSGSAAAGGDDAGLVEVLADDM